LLQRLLIAALIAGSLAAIVLTAAQAVRALPLIQQAEVYESAAAAQTGHHDEGWQPEGAARFAYTLLANLLAGIGFALLLVAGFAFFPPAAWWHGLIWGLGGFAAFALAPSLGLPPEPPGSVHAPLLARQLWWLLAAGGTALGLGLIAFAPRWAGKALGVLALALPHLLGAPAPPPEAAAVPDALARQFATASLLSNFAFWIALGPLAAWLFEKIVRKPRTDSAPS
jgi:cobalt transporter subunit CbtA